MNLLPTAISFGGIALCAMALVQFALWSVQSLSLISENKKQFQLSRELLRKQIENSKPAGNPDPELVDGRWTGFRTFRVSRIVSETDNCKSVYLQSEDGKPIATYRPGQHLTFKFQIPGEPKPVVRCYSLSNRPDQAFYRISVKSAPAPPQNPTVPPGRASGFINHLLKENDRIEVKSPSGHFVLDETDTGPIVLLAGGIGITPMVSMINHLIGNRTERMILLVYGVNNSADHAFKQHFEQLDNQHENFHVVNCYSAPGPQDVMGTDYQLKGFASVDLLKKILPNNQCQFYLCGPPPFMESLHAGLMEWGVSESRVFFEAFGPASIGKIKKRKTANATTPTVGDSVKFVRADVTTKWDSGCESLLELAENNGVAVEFGCRAGSCGTCETGLLKGKVSYPPEQAVDCPPGKCLICIARPDGPIELDA